MNKSQFEKLNKIINEKINVFVKKVWGAGYKLLYNYMVNTPHAFLQKQ